MVLQMNLMIDKVIRLTLPIVCHISLMVETAVWQLHGRPDDNYGQANKYNG